jgi:hypothetical protein
MAVAAALRVVFLLYITLVPLHSSLELAGWSTTGPATR